MLSIKRKQTLQTFNKSSEDKDSNILESDNLLPAWRPIVGVLYVLLIFIISQLFSSLLLSAYTGIIKGWSLAQSNNWLQHSIVAQFFYVAVAEVFTVLAIYLFLKYYKQNFKVIKLSRPHWRDLVYALSVLPLYFLSYIVLVIIASNIFPGLNINQHQHIGFNNVHGTAQLIYTAISLVILPPIAEEIMVRGLLYTSLRKWGPRFMAVIITSLLFASAHLPEGGASGPLWIAAIDTFTLSLFLIYLREKTNNLWASITLHAIKNGIAFYLLFLSPLLHL